MNTPTIPVNSSTSSLRGSKDVERRPLRVAVICDFLEEHWPSMDLVGNMLCSHLTVNCSEEVVITQVRPALRKRFTHVFDQVLPLNADRVINRFVDYPAWLRPRVGDFDIFHVVDHSYSHLIHELPANRTVVTCHDLDTFRCVLEPEREQRPRWFRMMANHILGGFRRASHVLAVSGATRNELLGHGLFAPEQISVVPNGVDPTCSAQPDAAADSAAARLLPGTADTAWLLNVGSNSPRKRLDVLLRVFAAVKRILPEAGLLRVGGLTPEQEQLAAELNIRSAIVTLPFLKRDVLAAVYRRAALLLHTAESEGFGLPVVEAMACGCPAVASDLPVLREIGGGEATYCPVAGITAWAEAVVRLLGERKQAPEAWQSRRIRGEAQGARFCWAENARRTARIYREVHAAVPL